MPLRAFGDHNHPQVPDVRRCADVPLTAPYKRQPDRGCSNSRAHRSLRRAGSTNSRPGIGSVRHITVELQQRREPALVSSSASVRSRLVTPGRSGVAGSVLVCVTLLAISCTGGSDDVASSDASRDASLTSTSSAATSCRPPAPEIPHEPPRARAVTVFVFCGPTFATPDLRAVERIVPDDGVPLRAALIQLMLGVTPVESSAGLVSAFSSYTAGQLRTATVENGVATLDLSAGFEETNNFSTTTMAGAVMSQFKTTVFQFPDIGGIEFEIDGKRWCGWEAPPCNEVPVPLLSRP